MAFLRYFMLTATLSSLLTALPIIAAEPEISLQWAICETDAAAVLAKLNHHNHDPYKSNPIVYFDTWPPHYTQTGIAFRTKVKKHDPGYPISMIKARFGELNENVPGAADCVWDRYGNDTTYTCGLASVLSEVGGAEGESVWSPEQRDFAGRYADVMWQDLVPFGPYMNPKWKIHLLGVKAVFDDVQALPLHLMEIEIGVPKAGSDAVYASVDAYLRERGVGLCEKQWPKTLRLFDFLVNEAGEEGFSDGTGQVVLGQ